MASKPSSERRKKAVPSRRRRDEDGEDEVSVAGEGEDDSLSDTSAISNADDDADVEPSDVSGDEDSLSADPPRHNTGIQPVVEQPATEGDTLDFDNDRFKASADTDAMLNGLKTDNANQKPVELHFDELKPGHADGAAPPAEDQQMESSKQESLAERNRREHQEYIKQRDADPAFVPNRGGFFLHDNRTLPSGPSNSRFLTRGRGRGHVNGIQLGRGAPVNEPTERPWTHDLHEVVTKPEQRPSGSTGRQQAPRQSTAAPVTGPNRSFSTTVIVGHVPVHIYLPGMRKRISIPNIVRKQHTLLPLHRPPLRRDKPVRISLPDIAPRYIFPSIERSFIFIPRAMRPNQSYQRGRGRGSFHGSRRPSIFGGSGYAASVAMSRQSSVGQTTPRDGVRSPSVSVMSGNVMPDQRTGRPVVRMPLVSYQTTNGPPAMMQPINSVTRENSQKALPMHQPRPQKNVSVADIESPASFTFNPIPQQEEQPFHQQVPVQIGAQVYGDGSRSRRPSFPQSQVRTPLNQIPDRAIYAQPFQPFPMYSAPAFYPPNAMFYQPLNPDGAVFGAGISQQTMPVAFVPGVIPAQAAQPAQPAQSNNIGAQANMVAHESNGMVFYYDPSSLPGGSQQSPIPQFPLSAPGGVLGIGGMITPPTQYYYPPPNGLYYAPH